MKFGKRYARSTVIMAMLHGVLIGIAGVVIIGIILIGSDGKKPNAEPKPDDVEIPITGPAPVDVEKPALPVGKSIEFFARQHGVFSSSESAQAFMNEDPSLASAAVVKGAGQYYVWSSIGTTEEEIMDSESEETFRKRLVVDAAACQTVGAASLQEVLSMTDVSKINISDTKKEGEEPSEFDKNMTAITTFTKDMRLVRLHLLAHYTVAQPCATITF
ncbi:hypothetical protein ACXYMX_05345 [Sporosarcina sp. CAU 1771]